MDLGNFEKMDVNILLSIVNMKLRDNFESLEELIKYYDIDAEKFLKKLELAGYTYRQETNQFH
jgi:predicted transcriptional regulator